MEDNQEFLIRRNLSTEAFLIEVIGEKQAPLTTAISMTLVYSLLLVTGVVGNICTCVVIARNKNMHTATNYYLFSLAISDLLLLIFGIPQEIHQLWQRYPYVLGEVFCIFRGMTSETSTNASILTITAFTVERYMAICHPLKAHTMSKLTRVIKLIVAIWCLGAVFAIPVIIHLGIVVQVDDGVALEESATCELKKPFDHAFVFSTIFFFMLPMTVITVLYLLIAIQLRRTSISKRNNCIIKGKVQHKGLCIKITRPDNSLGKKFQSSRRAVVKMLVAVVVAFFICWAPFHAQRLMAIYAKNPTPTDEIVYMVLTYISGVTYYVSATINPILYSILSVKFRQAFKDTLARCCGQHVPKRDTSSSFRYQSTIRTTGYEASEMSNCDSPRLRIDKMIQCQTDANATKIKISTTTNNISVPESKSSNCVTKANRPCS